ncbi:hypothetical protein ES332_A02G079500v1 [Gossypium tomentosum]|uniref:Uncharacterized protein n=1 Tax=Gossypium tomentosum TaxID=34277 RepID=A0A5D2RHC3_GOSTO|nr:hypothetical protein ES332_A02G079500v1 [Gossypium tomentosum]
MAWRETVRGCAGVEEWWRTWVHGGAENSCGLGLEKLGFLLWAVLIRPGQKLGLAPCLAR